MANKSQNTEAELRAEVERLKGEVERLKSENDLCRRAFETDDLLKIPEVCNLNVLQIVKKLAELSAIITPARADINAFWLALERSWEIEPRSYFEKEAPENGFGSPLAMAAHYNVETRHEHSGIGGMDLGLERAGMECVWQVEIDEFCRKVLTKHWPNVPKYNDVRECGQHNLEHVDLIAGGFPCQDIPSLAGNGSGLLGERSGLWFEFERLVRELRPAYVLVENVAALLDRGLGTVLSGLACCGYDAEWSTVSACSVGAPHMRRRLFILAYPNGVDGRTRVWNSEAQKIGPLQTIDSFEGTRTDWGVRLANPSQLYGGADGLSFGLERNRGIGNAVVPQVAEWIGKRIMEVANQCQ